LSFRGCLAFDGFEPGPLTEGEEARRRVFGRELAVHDLLAPVLDHEHRTAAAAVDMVRKAGDAGDRQGSGATDGAGLACEVAVVNPGTRG
jgi:hypothetical protein